MTTQTCIDANLNTVIPKMDTTTQAYLNSFGPLGYSGPLGPYGPLGILGPIGSNSWNPSSYIDFFNLSDLQNSDGPLS